MPAEREKNLKYKDIPCCPELAEKACCDRITFDYRLVHHVGKIPVEVKVSALFERCPGPLSLGDLVYSTTLLPGEKVRLFSSSRKSRFTFDRESEISYRHEQASEESFYMSSMSRFLSDLSVREDVHANQSSSGSFRSDGSVSGAIESFFFGPSGTIKGSHNASSTRDFVRELRSHAESSHHRSVQATRAASSISVGEVQTRTHTEGESESSFEAATRTIENRNRCQGVTYFAYQINKTQTVKFTITAISRRVVDPAADSKVETIPPRFAGEVSVIPQAVLATDTNRVAVESVARASSVADRAGVIAQGTEGTHSVQGSFAAGTVFAVAPQISAAQRFSTKEREDALEAVDKDLVAAGLLDKVGGQLSPRIADQLDLSFTVETCLPTPAILVKGCLDDCIVCEPGRQQEIKLDLERKELENRLLEKQIELLEKSQEYRCCPVGEAEEGGEA